MKKRLEGKCALVTGSSRGIGKAIALALADAGCNLVVNYHSRRSAAEEVAARIRSMARVCLVCQGDVSIVTEAEHLVGEAEQTFGAVDILVNNAGISRHQPVADIEQSDWDQTLRVNLTSVFWMTQRVLVKMRGRRWGRIINLSSIAAQNGGLVGPHYAASKAGLIGLTHSYAALLVNEGITVNAIAPALIDTDMVRMNPKATPEWLPGGEYGDPEEIGRVAVLLAESEFMTGQTISVNGGKYMTS